MQEEYMEKQPDMPKNWRSDVIFERDGKGMVSEVVIPDDSEEANDLVGND